MVTATDVSNAARALAAHFPLSTSGFSSGKLYEAWMMLEMGLSLRRKGWTVAWINPSSSGASTMVFRGSPGSLTPHSNPAPGYLHLSRNRYKLEMHNSLQYRGWSGALHEVDISILDADVANRCRANNWRPAGLPCVGLELKHYTGDLGIGLTRSMLMATTDLALLWSFRSNEGRVMQWTPTKTYAAMGNLEGSVVYILTTAERTGGSQVLTDFHGISLAQRVDIDATYIPGYHGDIDDLCDKIDNMFP
ncbi:hypothetical protein ACU8MP_29535 (plasmid) [Rhizobium leguminosarum]